MEEFPEGPGYRPRPGWVKGNPLNDPIYLARCQEAYPEWAANLTAIDEYLTERVPGYNIAQIKDKFGGLRFYWTAPKGFEGDTMEIAMEVMRMEGEAPVLR